MTISDTLRNSDLTDLVLSLQAQQLRAVDVVASAAKISAVDGRIVVADTEPVISEDGVDLADGVYNVLDVANEGIAAKLQIPVGYLRRMATERADLYDANVNGWLSTDSRSFLLRTLRPELLRPATDTNPATLRAFLSSSYRVMDNFDVLLAVLDGMRDVRANGELQAPEDFKITADLTERRMYVRVTSRKIAAYATNLLRQYRSPFTGEDALDDPRVFAGFTFSNSEVGNGAFKMVPRVEVKICSNGMVIGKDAVKEVHLGGRLDDGVVRWSEKTQTANLELVRSQTADAARTWLDIDYVQARLAEIEGMASKDVKDVPGTIKHVSTKLSFTEAQQDSILGAFIKGGQTTAGGVMHAVTAAAQEQESGDDAWNLERFGIEALGLAFAYNR